LNLAVIRGTFGQDGLVLSISVCFFIPQGFNLAWFGRHNQWYQCEGE